MHSLTDELKFMQLWQTPFFAASYLILQKHLKG